MMSASGYGKAEDVTYKEPGRLWMDVQEDERECGCERDPEADEAGDEPDER